MIIKIRKIMNIIFRNRKFIAFISIIIIFILIAIYGFNYTSPPVDVGIVHNNEIILSENTVFALEPNNYTYIKFTLPTGIWYLNGSVVSSTYVSVYILNMDQFQDLKNHKNFEYVYYVLANSEAVINITLNQGTYFLIFYNKNKNWGTGLEVISNFIIALKK